MATSTIKEDIICSGALFFALDTQRFLYLQRTKHKTAGQWGLVGGMAEKVEHEKSGLHFQVGDATDLAACITRAATEEELWDKLSNGISDRLTIQEVADQTLEIYRQIQEKRSVSNSQLNQQLSREN